MLSAMFSGKYAVIKDKDDRFFIDADGQNFIHILNYLRYGDLPPNPIAETIYREATYFGINSLVKELETFPQILVKVQRNNFRGLFPGYTECMEMIVKAASVETASQTSDIKILIHGKEIQPSHEDFNKFHICSCKGMNKIIYTAEITLGPWKGDSTEKDVLNCIIFDLEHRGFTVTSRFYAPCSYQFEGIYCEKLFYNICFHWWKS